MTRRRASAPPPLAHRLGLVLMLVAALLTQGWAAAAHAAAMAAGVEVCTAEGGVKRLGADGAAQPGDTAQHGDRCCLMPFSAPPPALGALAPVACASAARAAPPAACLDAAQLDPSSRDPPAIG